MKKWILCASVYFATAIPTDRVAATEVMSVANVEKHIEAVYKQFDFGGCTPLSYEAFNKAYRGYVNLVNAGKLSNHKQILTVCDFSQSSNMNRMWVLDMKSKKVLLNTYVAHGQGSGEEFATIFSNTNNSHQSSLGFYVTGSTYMGAHGNSLRLHGMDNGYNTAAFDRGIVMHGAAYVSKNYAQANNRLGRSWGCPAVSDKLAPQLISMIKEGTCLFIYYPQKQYLKTSYWVNKRIENLPSINSMENIMLASAKTTARDTMIVYTTPGGAPISTGYNWHLPLL